MTRDFFTSQMKILINDFGTAEYTSNRVKLIWDFCFELPEESFKKIVTHFCQTRSVKNPPLPENFREEALKQKRILRENRFCSTFDSEYSDGQALAEIMQQLGAKDVVDAIRKINKLNRK